MAIVAYFIFDHFVEVWNECLDRLGDEQVWMVSLH